MKRTTTRVRNVGTRIGTAVHKSYDCKHIVESISNPRVVDLLIGLKTERRTTLSGNLNWRRGGSGSVGTRADLNHCFVRGRGPSGGGGGVSGTDHDLIIGWYFSSNSLFHEA